MKHLRFIARSRLLWLLWLSLWTPVILFLQLLQIVWDALHHVYATYHWQYKYDLQDWFAKFGEKYRRSLGTLAQKPEKVRS